MPEAQGGAPQAPGPKAQSPTPQPPTPPQGGGIKSSSTPKSPTETLEDDVIVVGKDNKWAKDLKEATVVKAQDSIKKDNFIVDEYPIGKAFSEKAENASDLIFVDIDNKGAGVTILAIPGATAPLYSVALTRATIQKVVEEGFIVKKTNTDKFITIENGNLNIPS